MTKWMSSSTTALDMMFVDYFISLTTSYKTHAYICERKREDKNEMKGEEKVYEYDVERAISISVDLSAQLT
jgi:Ca2+/H+ antiporter